MLRPLEIVKSGLDMAATCLFSNTIRDSWESKAFQAIIYSKGSRTQRDLLPLVVNTVDNP